MSSVKAAEQWQSRRPARGVESCFKTYPSSQFIKKDALKTDARIALVGRVVRIDVRQHSRKRAVDG